MTKYQLLENHIQSKIGHTWHWQGTDWILNSYNKIRGDIGVDCCELNFSEDQEFSEGGGFFGDHQNQMPPQTSSPKPRKITLDNRLKLTDEHLSLLDWMAHKIGPKLDPQRKPGT